jgi:hypothetical protein
VNLVRVILPPLFLLLPLLVILLELLNHLLISIRVIPPPSVPLRLEVVPHLPINLIRSQVDPREFSLRSSGSLETGLHTMGHGPAVAARPRSEFGGRRQTQASLEKLRNGDGGQPRSLSHSLMRQRRLLGFVYVERHVRYVLGHVRVYLVTVLVH